MMAYVFGFLVVLSILVCAVAGTPSLALESMLKGSAEALTLCLSLAGAYMLFLGFIKIAEEAKLIQALSRRMQRLVSFLIPDAKDAAGPITLNLAANVLGLGNAATPFGLAAMEKLQRNNPNKTLATHGMCMFLCINASSIQLIPTSVIALRAAQGSADPANIILPTLFATACSTIVAVVGCRIMQKRTL